MKSSAIATVLLSLAIPLAAQTPVEPPPEIASLDAYPTVTWDQEVEGASLAGLRWEEQPGEFTIVMLHTTVDPEKAGQLVAEGVGKTLPFLVLPPANGWTDAEPEFEAVPEFEFSGEPLMIPPGRVVNHLQQFVASGYAAGYGTKNTDSSTVLRYAADGMVADPVPVSDERYAWSVARWENVATGLQGFDVPLLLQQAVIQSAHTYAETLTPPPQIDADGLQKVSDELGNLGFVTYVQPITVIPPTHTSSRVRIRYKRFTRIRHYSLLSSSEWLALKGKARHIANPLNGDQNLFFAPLGDEMHITFPTAVATLARPTPLRAYVPTSSGVVIVDQISNPVLTDEFGQQYLLAPDIAIFPVLPDAIAGVVYFERTLDPGVPVVPFGAVQFGALFLPYVYSGNP